MQILVGKPLFGFWFFLCTDYITKDYLNKIVDYRLVNNGHTFNKSVKMFNQHCTWTTESPILTLFSHLDTNSINCALFIDAPLIILTNKLKFCIN